MCPQHRFGETESPDGARRVTIMRALFDDDIHVAEMDPRTADPAALLPDEWEAVAHAVDRRRREFASGRLLARALFDELHLPTRLAVGIGRNGCPVWPEGVVGSITHTTSWAAAVVARREVASSLGCDLEQDHPLPDPLWKLVCSVAEQGFLASRPEAERGRLATLLFSARECFYKAQYPVTGRALGFRDVEIELDIRSGVFRAVLRRSVAPLRCGQGLGGRFRFHRGLVATAMTLPPAERRETAVSLVPRSERDPARTGDHDDLRGGRNR